MRPVLPEGLRPLDPVRSIKAKLGLLVFASITASALLIYFCLVVFGWRARYGLTVSVLVGLAVTQFLAHGMTSPLRQMTAAARQMAVGRPPGPVSTTSRDEVGDLARAFTAMAGDLASADAQRRDLMANVAHELRTPLAAVRAQLENLVDGVRPADEAALGEVLDQVENLSGLLDDLLGLARAEAGVTPLARRLVVLREVVDAVVADVGAARPDVRIVVEMSESLAVEVDPSRMRPAITNLVDNATRHAGDHGTVLVRARLDQAGALLLEVVDDGPGIAEQDRTQVFERFRRGAVPATAESVGDSGHQTATPTGGTGLGLAIARWAVELHGGRIEVAPSEAGCHIRVAVPDAAPG